MLLVQKGKRRLGSKEEKWKDNMWSPIQLKAVFVFGSRAHGVTGHSGVHGPRQCSWPLWLVGQATPDKGLDLSDFTSVCTVPLGLLGTRQFTKHDVIAEHITS